eukprot:TRINITY_DN7541_c0_g1_i1.p1 TRINITY_DN7541_c0_g1~~TRINITY_DN7541_c0_g1_i1.p1  ORF type:complete len:406 (-),score=107.30 TRINITY_DN7541_c0_g1_i1:217-1434(-)
MGGCVRFLLLFLPLLVPAEGDDPFGDIAALFAAGAAVGGTAAAAGGTAAAAEGAAAGAAAATAGAAATGGAAEGAAVGAAAATAGAAKKATASAAESATAKKAAANAAESAAAGSGEVGAAATSAEAAVAADAVESEATVAGEEVINAVSELLAEAGEGAAKGEVAAEEAAADGSAAREEISREADDEFNMYVEDLAKKAAKKMLEDKDDDKTKEILDECWHLDHAQTKQFEQIQRYTFVKEDKDPLGEVAVMGDALCSVMTKIQKGEQALVDHLRSMDACDDDFKSKACGEALTMSLSNELLSGLLTADYGALGPIAQFGDALVEILVPFAVTGLQKIIASDAIRGWESDGFQHELHDVLAAWARASVRKLFRRTCEDMAKAVKHTPWASSEALSKYSEKDIYG